MGRPKIIPRNRVGYPDYLTDDLRWKLKSDFHMQRVSARGRGIGFELTWDQWLNIWIVSGHLLERGKGAGKYCMARHGDVGPYAVGNVSIVTFEENLRDRVFSAEHRRKISEASKGRVCSEVTRRKLSAALKGKVKSAEHCRKLSLALTGLVRSAETRRKISLAQNKGKPLSPERYLACLGGHNYRRLANVVEARL